MSIDERTRHKLYRTLEERLGREEADAMMDLLPPVGWADVATKHDVEDLRRNVDLQFEHLRAELVSVEVRIKAEVTSAMNQGMVEQTRHMVRWLVIGNAATVGTIAGLAFAAARLT